MIAKQIEAPGLESTYSGEGDLKDVLGYASAPDRLDKRTNIRYKPTHMRYMAMAKELIVGGSCFDDKGITQLEEFLTAIRHLRPGGDVLGGSEDVDEVSPDNSKDLEEAITLFRDAWGYVPIRLRAAIAKVLEESIENGEAFIKSAREVRGDNE